MKHPPRILRTTEPTTLPTNAMPITTLPQSSTTEGETSISLPAPQPNALEPWLAFIAQKVRSLEYGSIQIVIHDSRVVQIEATERRRFDVRRAG
jgi:hypothetical protein